MTEEKMPAYLTCLLVNVADKKLLLPNTTVAEIVPYRHVEKIPGTGDWLAGVIEWRGLRLPVLSYAGLSAADAPDVPDRVVILNAIGGRKDFRFYAMGIQGIPASVRVDAGLMTDTTVSLAEYELQAVRLANQTAYIPDLTVLESMLLGVDTQGWQEAGEAE